jgi:hypothetical protein
MLRPGSCALAIAYLFIGPAFAGGPAPKEDRVGFPKGYRENYHVLYVFDRPDNRQVRVIYGNDEAASRREEGDFPYGSILVMETYPARLDSEGRPILDGKGRFQRASEEPTALFVTRKEKGFGEAYQDLRTGEWEYVAYRPDGSYQTPPQQSAPCARCHLQAGPQRDWQFRLNLYYRSASGALPISVAQHYRFLPQDLTLPEGGVVTWYNDDEVEHRIVVNALGFDSGNMREHTSAAQVFQEAGDYEFQCTIHPSMRGIIHVVPVKNP